MKPRRCLCVLLGIGALSWATPAAAATITVTGTDGAPGIDGTAGGDGGPGGPGGDATATATGPDTSNSADATGGTGGAGGAGSPPGIDGAGGMGGHAQASASASGSSGDVNVSATAQGGTGGTGTSGGQGGTADIGLVSGSSTSDGLLVVGATASGGDGGVALSSSNAAIGHQGDGGSSSIVNAISASGPGTLVIGQSATGGNAGRDPSGTSQAGAGVGGNASSSLTLTLPTISSYAQVISFAQGGAGSEGEASPGRTVGNGGNGTAFLDLTTSDRPTYAQANSYGGQGIGLGNGGAASSVSHLHLVGDGLFGSVQSNATGGDGGVGFCAHGGDFCRGGDATSISTADAVGNSPSSSQSFAYGGAGGSADPASAVRQDGARGGDATASASATSPDSAQAGAGAYGGAGGDGAGPGSLGGAGGTASASAFASAPSSASAGVSVTGGRGGGGAGGAARGGDVDLENVPVAESPGQVSLSQGAYGGDSGPGPGSRGGDARSVLTVSGVPTGTLSIEADAAGGTASGTDGSARGGNASVVADAIGSGSQNVYVSAGVTAGTIADGIGTPGTATLERVHGSSDTGAVSVYGWVTGGGWPNGISVDLVDGVQGETAGSLSLTQAAYGGDSLTSAGNASSRLHHDGSSTSLLVQTDANGGNVSDSNPNGGHLVTLSGGGTGAALTGVQQAGAAFAESEGTNTGDTGASAYAVGGSTPRGIAGDAEADATAHGLGGAPGAQVTASSAAYAGQVSDIYSAGPGQGGSARAVSLATAENAAPGSVTSSATASGGLTPAAGSGGTAVAEATSISTATGSAQQITASAAAYGGAVLSLPNDQGISFPTSVAAAASTATAQGLASRLLAEATTIGGSDSTATSHLLTERDALVGLHAQLAASDGIQSAVHTTALAGLQESLSDARNRALGTSGAHAGAYLSSVESPLTSWVTGNTNVMNSLSQGGTIVAQGLFTSDLSQDWTGSTTVELDRSQLKGSTPFRIGLLDPEIPTVGLDLLEVHISVDGNPVADMTFNSAAAAAAALDDQLVTVDPSNVGTGPIARIVVGMVLHASAATGTEVFLSNFVVIAPVPEPAVWMLVALGALVLGARRLTTGALILAAQRLTRGTFRAVIPGVVERRALCVLLSAGMACVPGLSLVASSADAASIAISGTNGTPGVDGAPGNPGRNGTAGGAGGDANATSAGLDPSNSATATGGAGGAGGKGGNAQPSSGVPGNGGAGGAGGNATASATTTTEDPDTFTAVSTATATGGVGGAGGLGGTSSGSPGATGAGGAGGNAYASSSAVGRNAATALSTASAGHLGNASVNAFANAVVPDPGGTTPFVGLGQATAEGTTDYLLHSFAEARGHGGSFATATAHSTEGVLPLVMSTVTANTGALAADLRSDVKLRASTSELAQLATSGPATVVEAMPFYDPRPLIGGFPTIESSLDATSKIVALAAFTSGVGKSGLSNSDWSGEFRFGVDRSLLLSPDLSLGFLGVNVPEVGFDAMSLHISVDGAPVADFSFTDPETVYSTLQDHVVHVDLPASSPSDIATLVVSLDAHMLPQSYVFAGFALIAHTTSPEPAGLALCVLGIGLLAARRWLFA